MANDEENMKNLTFILLLILLVSGIVFSADPAILDRGLLSGFYSQNNKDDEAEQVIKKNFKVTPGSLLDIDLESGGSINVKGWDKNEVDVKASLTGKNWKKLEVNIEENSGNVTITSKLLNHHHGNSNASVDLEIFVPQKYNVSFETMGGGVTLMNIEGEMNGQTMGGSLKLAQLKGNLSLKTMGGNIDLIDSDVDGKVETMGGHVTVDNVSGGVQGSSMGGNVEYKNIKRSDNSNSHEKIVISTMGGAINLDDAPNGAEVKTMGGGININSASKFVKANTMGGDITINKIDGDADVTTMSGDVDIKVLGDSKTTGRDIHLVSMNGDVIVKVPKDFSMEINARIENDSFEITSDFPLSKKRISDDEDDDEYILGTGKISGGNNMVKLEAKNGNIRIESY
jgi:hypothetical protein